MPTSRISCLPTSFISGDEGIPLGVFLLVPAGRSRSAQIQPGERDRTANGAHEHRSRRDFLDGEIDTGELSLPAGLEAGYRLQDKIIKTLRPGAVQRHTRWDERSTQPSAMPVPPPDAVKGLRVLAVAILHTSRA